MKPAELEPGDHFRIAAAADPEELKDFYEVMCIETKSVRIRDRDVVIGISMTVKVNGQGEPVPLGIGPWVEIERIK